jgi:hypothetical protein
LTIEIKPDDEKISYLERDDCEGHETLEMCRNDQKCKPKISGNIITDSSGNRKWVNFFQCFACERFDNIKEHIRKKSIFKSKFNDSLFQIIHGLIFKSKTRHYGYKYFIFKAMRTNYLYILFSIGEDKIDFNKEIQDREEILKDAINYIRDNATSYVGDFIICGHSMGCSMVLHMAYLLKKDHNDLFKRCVFIGTGQYRYLPIDIADDLSTNDNIHIFIYAQEHEKDPTIEIDSIFLLGPNNERPKPKMEKILLAHKNNTLPTTGVKYKAYEPFNILLKKKNNTVEVIKWNEFKLSKLSKLSIEYKNVSKNTFLHAWARYQDVLQKII